MVKMGCFHAKFIFWWMLYVSTNEMFLVDFPLIKSVGAHTRTGLIRLEFSVFVPFCLHRLISGHKGVLLVSVVNLLKNHCTLCFFRRLVL